MASPSSVRWAEEVEGWMDDALGENDPLSLRHVATNDAMMTPHSHLGMLTKREKRKRGAGRPFLPYAMRWDSNWWSIHPIVTVLCATGSLVKKMRTRKRGSLMNAARLLTADRTRNVDELGISDPSLSVHHNAN